ncbi:MAG: hypothetical protein EOP05_07515, partial [Proteobacteria bacterium]
MIGWSSKKELKVAQAKNPNDASMELGKLYHARCDFGLAIEHFNDAAAGYYEEKNFELYLK